MAQNLELSCVLNPPVDESLLQCGCVLLGSSSHCFEGTVIVWYVENCSPGDLGHVATHLPKPHDIISQKVVILVLYDPIP